MRSSIANHLKYFKNKQKSPADNTLLTFLKVYDNIRVSLKKMGANFAVPDEFFPLLAKFYLSYLKL